MQNVKYNNKTILKIISVTLFLMLSVFAVVFGLYDYFIPNNIVLFSDESITAAVDIPFITITPTDNVIPAMSNIDTKTETDNNYDVKIFGTIPLKSINVNTLERIKLYPGGMPFGVKFYTSGVLVVGLTDIDTSDGVINPAQEAGLRVKDIITKVNDNEVNTVEEVTNYIEMSNGNELKITVCRNNIEDDLYVTPIFSSMDDNYKAGIWIRDSTAGIGTITFINPENNTFAGLGHGICDIDTGELMPMLKGQVVDVSISGINKGKAGYPGELKGYFNSSKIGALIGNTNSGVYGTLVNQLNSIPSEPLPIALKKDIHEGDAYIYCTTESNTVEKFDIEIIKINKNDSDLKNFILKIKDEKLLNSTGGIVQGMSGSPVIQDGRIIGAVTHVLINDPTKGYGIFIETMLTNMPEILNSSK